MVTRVLAVVCLAAALAVTTTTAQAGKVKDLAKIAKVTVIGNGTHLKNGIKGGAKWAKDVAHGNANVARCTIRVLKGGKSCF